MFFCRATHKRSPPASADEARRNRRRNRPTCDGQKKRATSGKSRPRDRLGVQTDSVRRPNPQRRAHKNTTRRHDQGPKQRARADARCSRLARRARGHRARALQSTAHETAASRRTNHATSLRPTSRARRCALPLRLAREGYAVPARNRLSPTATAADATGRHKPWRAPTRNPRHKTTRPNAPQARQTRIRQARAPPTRIRQHRSQNVPPARPPTHDRRRQRSPDRLRTPRPSRNPTGARVARARYRTRHPSPVCAQTMKIQVPNLRTC